MKIAKVTSDFILFDNGSKITFDHEKDCCECNFADFEQIEESALNYNFPQNLTFEKVEGSGFRFGGNRMFFIPCYSHQNGYYSSDIDIYFDGEKVLNFECEERVY